MSETATPDTKPRPTHVVEVYLQDGASLTGVGRSDRYFYVSLGAAEEAYEMLTSVLSDHMAKANDVPPTLEVWDFYGKGFLITRDLRGVRLFASAELDDWAIERDMRAAGAKAAAKHAVTRA